MSRPSMRAPLLCALMLHAGAQAAGPASSAGTVQPADLAKLIRRIERLEQENRELRARLDAGGAPAAPTAATSMPAAPSTEQRLKTLEDAKAKADHALASERLSENEPELVTRLKAVEFQVLERQKQARQIEALEGVSVGAGLTTVVQNVNAAGAADGRRQTRANYRGDVSVGLPGGEMGDIEGNLFAHFRLGQGSGVALRPTYTSTANTTAFETAAGPDDSFAILAQAWYQLSIPLPRDGVKAHSKQRIEINIGKIDPFVFFDQNAIADDESVRFLNNAFVHNPLLDSGGDVGADTYGFAPGVRAAYINNAVPGQGWGASLGVFGSGPGANFSGSLGKPFVIAQLETSRRFFGGLAGNYRVYAWRNGQASDHDGAIARHSGVGLSIDQRIDDDWTLFTRYGHQLSGHPRFDRALTLGAETDGSRWGRGADAVGIAAGLLRTSGAYRDATAGAPGAAGGSERIAELYYRYHLNSRVQLTPDLQWIQRPAGEGDARAVRVFGLRAKVGF